jgi:uncharacterized protein YkwD
MQKFFRLAFLSAFFLLPFGVSAKTLEIEIPSINTRAIIDISDKTISQLVRSTLERREFRLRLLSRADTRPARTTRPTRATTIATAPSSAITDSVSSTRQRILELVNIERKKVSASALIMNGALQNSAQRHAEDMKNRTYFSHTNLDGLSSMDRIKAAGYPGASSLTATCPCRYNYGENIARGQETAEKVMEDWMNSPGHKKNILSTSYKEMGVGFVDNHWVQNFGGVHGK